MWSRTRMWSASYCGRWDFVGGLFEDSIGRLYWITRRRTADKGAVDIVQAQHAKHILGHHAVALARQRLALCAVARDINKMREDRRPSTCALGFAHRSERPHPVGRCGLNLYGTAKKTGTPC